MKVEHKKGSIWKLEMISIHKKVKRYISCGKELWRPKYKGDSPGRIWTPEEVAEENNRRMQVSN